jgi:hypothetical protein
MLGEGRPSMSFCFAGVTKEEKVLSRLLPAPRVSPQLVAQGSGFLHSPLVSLFARAQSARIATNEGGY